MSRMRLLAALVVLAAATAPLSAQRDTPCRDREPEILSAAIAAPDEPGERLVITGRVLQGEAAEPVGGARLLAFHTDADGYYSVGGMDEQHARLCGVLLTDDSGRYRFETIRPAHYATGGPPAHIHFELTLPGESMQRFSLTFEGDPKLGGRKAGELWETTRPIVEHDGVLRVERDLWVR